MKEISKHNGRDRDETSEKDKSYRNDLRWPLIKCMALMKDIVKINDDRFVVLVKVGAKKYQIIETFKKDLEQYAKLRNAIVHEKCKSDIISPNQTPKWSSI